MTRRLDLAIRPLLIDGMLEKMWNDTGQDGGQDHMISLPPLRPPPSPRNGPDDQTSEIEHPLIRQPCQHAQHIFA